MAKDKQLSIKFSTKGHALAKDIFRNQILKNKLSSVYLINGPKGIDKKSIVTDLINIIRCQDDLKKPCGKCEFCKSSKKKKQADPDLSIISPGEKGSIKIEQMREMKKKSSFKKLANKKIFWIQEAHNLTNQAANSILKVLEDSAQTGKEIIFFLTANNLNLPDTVISRAQIIFLTPNVKKKFKDKQNVPEKAIASSGLDKDLENYQNKKRERKRVNKYYKSYQYLKKAKVSDKLKYVNEKLVKNSVKDLIESWIIFERYNLLNNYSKKSEYNLKMLTQVVGLANHSINKKILLKKIALTLK